MFDTLTRILKLPDGILDRLVHNAHRLELHGESLRKTRAKKPEAKSETHCRLLNELGQRKGPIRRPFLCTPSSGKIETLLLLSEQQPPASASLRTAPLNTLLDHSDHFRDNQPASGAALRSLIGIRRIADRLPSGTLIDLTRIRSVMTRRKNFLSSPSLKERLSLCRVRLQVIDLAGAGSIV